MTIPPLVTFFAQTMMQRSAKKQQQASAEKALEAQKRQADIQADIAAQKSKSESVGGRSSSQTAGLSGKKKKTLGRSGLKISGY